MNTMKKIMYFHFLCLTLLICSGCTDSTDSNIPPDSPVSTSRSGDHSPGGSDLSSTESVKGSRDNTVTVLVPSNDGTVTYEDNGAVIDASHSDAGYIMVSYTGDNPKVKLGITGSDQITYYYDLHGGAETFPLTAGDGDYTVAVFENISDTQYSTALSTVIPVTLSNEFGPFLYPSQYVNFTDKSDAVRKGAELAYTANSDMEVLQQVYNYIIQNITYDYDKASTVQSGYLPDVDETLRTGKGICFDYASLMAAMLRSQRIPTRLEIGYKGEEYHAWISVYLPEHGWVNGIIEFDGRSWKLMDPTFASTSKKPRDFITENDDYITKYVY